MGADFVIQSIGLKANGDGGIDEHWVKSALSQTRRAIDAIDEAQLDHINAEHGIVHDHIEAYQRGLQQCLTDIEEAVLGDHRQAAIIHGGRGIVLLLAGGMSWGDPPTELFESMSRLADAEVMPDARWPKNKKPRKAQRS